MELLTRLMAFLISFNWVDIAIKNPDIEGVIFDIITPTILLDFLNPRRVKTVKNPRANTNRKIHKDLEQRMIGIKRVI